MIATRGILEEMEEEVAESVKADEFTWNRVIEKVKRRVKPMELSESSSISANGVSANRGSQKKYRNTRSRTVSENQRKRDLCSKYNTCSSVFSRRNTE